MSTRVGMPKAEAEAKKPRAKKAAPKKSAETTPKAEEAVQETAEEAMPKAEAEATE